MTAANTPFYIIQDALSEAKLLQEGDQPSPEQYASVLRKLNDLINVWQTQGLKLWLQSDTAVPLVSGQAAYTLGLSGDVDMVKPLRAPLAYYADASSPANNRPLNILSWQEYLALGQRAQTGALTSIFIDKRQSVLSVSCWPVPDATAATGTLHLLLHKQVVGPVSLTETMNFPIEWRIALVWGLAAEVCTGQPQAVVQRCESRAEMYRKMLEDWDVEDAVTRFTPNMQQTAYSKGAFR